MRSAGAEKLMVTSTAFDNPDLLGELATHYGAQAVVLGLDTVRRESGAYGLLDHRTRETVPDVDPEDGTRVREHRWTGCQGPTEVTLLQIEGGGHTWPMPVNRYSVTLGRFSEELGGSQVAVDFFSGIDAALR